MPFLRISRLMSRGRLRRNGELPRHGAAKPLHRVGYCGILILGKIRFHKELDLVLLL